MELLYYMYQYYTSSSMAPFQPSPGQGFLAFCPSVYFKFQSMLWLVIWLKTVGQQVRLSHTFRVPHADLDTAVPAVYFKVHSTLQHFAVQHISKQFLGVIIRSISPLRTWPHKLVPCSFPIAWTSYWLPVCKRTSRHHSQPKFWLLAVIYACNRILVMLWYMRSYRPETWSFDL